MKKVLMHGMSLGALVAGLAAMKPSPDPKPVPAKKLPEGTRSHRGDPFLIGIEPDESHADRMIRKKKQRILRRHIHLNGNA